MGEPHLRWATSVEAAIRTARPGSLAALDVVLTTWRATLEALEQEPAEERAVGAGIQTEAPGRAAAVPRESEGEEPPLAETRGRPRGGHEMRMYLVTQTDQPGALGLHRATWLQMEERLALGRFGIAGSGARARRVRSTTQAEQLWEAAGRRLPMPVVDPAP